MARPQLEELAPNFFYPQLDSTMKWKNETNVLMLWNSEIMMIILVYVFVRPIQWPSTKYPAVRCHCVLVNKLVWHVYWNWCRHHYSTLLLWWKYHCCMDLYAGIPDALQLIRFEIDAHTCQISLDHDFQSPSVSRVAVIPVKWHHFYYITFLKCIIKQLDIKRALSKLWPMYSWHSRIEICFSFNFAIFSFEMQLQIAECQLWLCVCLWM